MVPMVRELRAGGVIQYPATATLQNTSQNHEYQNTVTPFKSQCECLPQMSGVPARHNSAPCVSGPLSSVDTGPALGPTVGLQHQLSPGAPLPTVSNNMMYPTVSSSMMYPSSITGQFLLQQINTELINLQIKVLQNQLEQAKLQQEMIRSQP